MPLLLTIFFAIGVGAIAGLLVTIVFCLIRDLIHDAPRRKS